MRVTNLPTDVLRAFIAVVDLGSFTRAGELLGRTQPAISLQIRKLEELVGMPLLDTSGRNIALTKDGEVMSRYARQLLCLNDEIVARLQKQGPEGTIRIGLPTDYAVAFFQKTLTHYLSHHPEVQLEIHCDLSDLLLKRLADDELDVVIAMYDGSPPPGLIFTWAERPIWVAASDSESFRQNPVPIAAHPPGCHYRDRMIKCLDQIGRPWRVTYSSPGINGLQMAVQAGLGVSALTRRTLTRGMRVLKEPDGFPPMTDIRLGLCFKNTGASTAGLTLTSHVMQALHDSGQTDLVRLDRLEGATTAS